MKPIEKQADRLFAAFIRARDVNCLLADGKCWGELEVHHLIFRSRDPGHRVRWDPRNGRLLCSFHHGDMHGHPLKHDAWIQDLLGAAYPRLRARAYGGPKPDVAAIVEQLKAS